MILILLRSHKELGVQELLRPLLAMSSSNPLGSDSREAGLEPGETGTLIGDIVRRFEEDGLEDYLGDLVRNVVNVVREDRNGLGGSGNWRSAVLALEALASMKGVASMVSLSAIDQMDFIAVLLLIRIYFS